VAIRAVRLGRDVDEHSVLLAQAKAELANAVSQSDWRLMLAGHEGPVWSAEFSPDGLRIVTGSEDKTARVWNAATGQELVALRGHEGAVRSAAFSPDGLRVVTGSDDKTARVWDAAIGQELVTLRGHEGAVRSAAFSPDGLRVVTGSADGTARLWDAATGKELVAVRGHESAILSAGFSPDGFRVVTGSADKTARIWDVRFATIATEGLIVEACTRRLRGLTVLTRDEMRLIGKSDDKPPIDVCVGVD